MEASPAEIEFFRASIDAGHAKDWGARHESGAVLDDFLAATGPVVDAILAGRIAGYGPLRFGYACGVAHELASGVRTLDDATVVEPLSDVARWSRPDEFERLIQPAA